jgi:hypothetical protein
MSAGRVICLAATVSFHRGRSAYCRSAMANAAVENTWPECCSCDAKVARDEVARWVVFLPHKPNDTRMMGVFCPVCFELGTNKTVEHMMEFGQVLSLH